MISCRWPLQVVKARAPPLLPVGHDAAHLSSRAAPPLPTPPICSPSTRFSKPPSRSPQIKYRPPPPFSPPIPAPAPTLPKAGTPPVPLPVRVSLHKRTCARAPASVARQCGAGRHLVLCAFWRWFFLHNTSAGFQLCFTFSCPAGQSNISSWSWVAFGFRRLAVLSLCSWSSDLGGINLETQSLGRDEINKKEERSSAASRRKLKIRGFYLFFFKCNVTFVIWMRSS